MIDIFGADHHGYIARLKSGIHMMGEDENKLTVKILQMVRLIKDGEEFLNQNDEFPVDLCKIVVVPPTSILLHSATSLPDA